MAYRDYEPTRPYPPAESEEVVEEGYTRIRVVRVICTIISAVCAIFAIVLLIHIFLVIGSANPDNGFAQLIGAWASGITLGLSNLFTAGGEKVQTFLNEGLAALLWLAIGGGLTAIIGRIFLPGPARRIRYRRTVR
ncbi:DUF2417 domain-containing protein [Fodinicola acaciae]|uniref:DUF2417 domain-containing protein n=1 Tax=Fodinicola acaciae TaxID=2681555 RepID=UPI0013D3DB97|nr:DUF2417 domain-containing protein [Fodinicola acaciae]